MPKKKRVGTITEYPRNEHQNALSLWSVQQIFGKYTRYGVAKFISINREQSIVDGLQMFEIHGQIAGQDLHKLGSDTWELLECEIIIIPRRRIKSLRTKKDDLPMMSQCTAQQLYLGSDLFIKGENSYYFRDDPDTTSYDNEYMEIINKIE